MSRIPYTNKVGETLSSIADSAAAYSLRALGGGDPMVTRIRRSSDDEEKDFTASDVSGGALVDWVNEDVVNYQSDFSSSSGNFVSNNSSWTYNNVNSWEYDATQNGTLYKNVGLEPGKSHRITITAVSASTEIRLYSHYLAQTTLFTNIPKNQQLTLSVGDNVFEGVVPNDGAEVFMMVAYVNGGAFNVSSIKVEQLTADGFVTTWYDQSGNSNDATQSTAASQPKIVDGGVLVSDGIDFDGSSDFLGALSLAGATAINQTPTISFVWDARDNGQTVQRIVNYGNWPNLGGYNIQVSSARNISVNFKQSGANADYAAFVSSSNVFNFGEIIQITAIIDISGPTLYINGSLVTLTEIVSPTGTYGEGSTNLYVGNSQSPSPIRYTKGSIPEIIIYNSDQSANRAAIETNINNYYDID